MPRKQEWASFLTDVFVRMLCKGEGRTRYLGRKNQVKIRKIVTTIKRHDDLARRYLELCARYGHSDIICISTIHLIIRNVLYSLYRDGVEPVASIVDIIIKRGYISLDMLDGLSVACDVKCNEGEERNDGE